MTRVEPVGVARLVVVDEVRLYREGLTATLRRRDHIDVVGTASDLVSANRLVTELQPNVVLVHLKRWDQANHVGVIASITSAAPVVAVGVNEVPEEVIPCAQAGITGYVSYDASLDEMVSTVEAVARGEAALSPGVAACLLEGVSMTSRNQFTSPPRLTCRELEVVELIDEGLSNKEIAQRLSIRLPTVKNHVHNILEKLQLRHRREAAAILRTGHVGGNGSCGESQDPGPSLERGRRI